MELRRFADRRSRAGALLALAASCAGIATFFVVQSFVLPKIAAIDDARSLIRARVTLSDDHVDPPHLDWPTLVDVAQRSGAAVHEHDPRLMALVGLLDVRRANTGQIEVVCRPDGVLSQETRLSVVRALAQHLLARQAEPSRTSTAREWLSAARSWVDRMRPSSRSATTTSDVSVAQLQASLLERRAALLTERTALHPEVRAIDEQLSALVARHTAEANVGHVRRTAHESSIDEDYQRLIGDLDDLAQRVEPRPLGASPQEMVIHVESVSASESAWGLLLAMAMSMSTTALVWLVGHGLARGDHVPGRVLARLPHR